MTNRIMVPAIRTGTLAFSGDRASGSGGGLSNVLPDELQYLISEFNNFLLNLQSVLDNYEYEKASDQLFIVDAVRIGTGDAYIDIDGSATRIRSSNYVTGVGGAGFTLEPGLLEVGNIRARGTIRTVVFQKDVVSSIGGNLLVAPSDVLAVDMTADDDSTLEIDGDETFAVNDVLYIKDDTDEEWLQVTNIANAPEYVVTRDKAGDYSADANPAWKKGATVVNYRQSGDCLILLSASDTNAPFITMFTHAGSPWSTTTTLCRVGNLNGYLGYSSDTYGFVAGSGDDWVKIDPTNGIRISSSASGGLTIKGGGDIVLEGGSSGDPSLIRFDDSTVPGQIRFERSGSPSKYHKMYCLAVPNVADLTFEPIGFTTYSPRFIVGTQTYPYSSAHIVATGLINFNIYPGHALQIDDSEGLLWYSNTLPFRPSFDSAVTLGTSSYCWSNIYGDAGVTACSDRKWKEKIKESQLGLDFIKKLDIIKWEFNSKTGKSRKGTFHGVLAQDVLSVIEEMGYSNHDFAGVEINDVLDDDGNKIGENYGFVYEQLIGPLCKSIQEIDDRLGKLEVQRGNVQHRPTVSDDRGTGS